MRVKPPFAVILALAAAPAWAQPAAESCVMPEQAESVRLAGLDRHGDIRLEDGRTVRLAGLAPRQSEAEREHFAAQLERWRGSEFRLAALGAADRWGRIPARLQEAAAAGPPAKVDLTAALLAAGAGLRLPEPGLAGCNALWRAAEPRPAAAGLSQLANSATASGNFVAGALPVVDGHDPAAMRAHAGRIVVVEGRIAAVGERTQRIYLNFERRRGAGGSIVLSRPLWRELQRTGWTASSLTGKRVRVRGVVEGRDGLLVEIDSRAALEMID